MEARALSISVNGKDFADRSFAHKKLLDSSVIQNHPVPDCPVLGSKQFLRPSICVFLPSIFGADFESNKIDMASGAFVTGSILSEHPVLSSTWPLQLPWYKASAALGAQPCCAVCSYVAVQKWPLQLFCGLQGQYSTCCVPRPSCIGCFVWRCPVLAGIKKSL